MAGIVHRRVPSVQRSKQLPATWLQASTAVLRLVLRRRLLQSERRDWPSVVAATSLRVPQKSDDWTPVVIDYRADSTVSSRLMTQSCLLTRHCVTVASYTSAEVNNWLMVVDSEAETDVTVVTADWHLSFRQPHWDCSPSC